MRSLVIWVLLAATCSPCEPCSGKPLNCPEPPAQIARDVNVETRAKLTALGKLGAGELQNKVQLTVRPLLDNVPNADRFLFASMLTSVFCQLVSDERIDAREKLDRFDVFSKTVIGMVTPPPAPSGGSARRPSTQSAVPKSVPAAAKTVKSSATAKPVGLGASVKEVGEYLADRSLSWTREKPYAVAFPRTLGDLRFTEEIGFDDNDRAIGHSLLVKAERISGRKPRTIGSEPREFCDSAPQKLIRALSAKLGAPTQPLTQESKLVPVDWSRLGYDTAPCDPISHGRCEASARRTSSRAVFELGNSQVMLTADLLDIRHTRAKTIASSVYEKSSLSCTIRIDDESFVLLESLGETPKYGTE